MWKWQDHRWCCPTLWFIPLHLDRINQRMQAVFTAMRRAIGMVCRLQVSRNKRKKFLQSLRSK